jgi:hypothetical protein
VNVTSPTGVQEIDAIEGRSLEVEILDGVERQLEAWRAGGYGRDRRAGRDRLATSVGN